MGPSAVEMFVFLGFFLFFLRNERALLFLSGNEKTMGRGERHAERRARAAGGRGLLHGTPCGRLGVSHLQALFL